MNFLSVAFPFSSMLPLSGFISPAIRESRVDLPHPEGPTTAVNSPGARENEISDRAFVSPSNV